MRVRAPAFATLILAAGCTTWQPVALPAPQDSTYQATGRLRVTTTDGRHIQADTLQRVGDSLRVGKVRGGPAPAVAFAQVAGIEASTVDKDHTAFLLLGIVALGVVWLLAASSVQTGY